MSYIDRNEQGQIVGLYACAQREGQEYLEGAELYVPPPTALDQIRALEQTHIDDQRKLNRQAAIDTALTVACRSPAAEGKTRDEVHAIYYATNRGYRAMVDLEAQIAELRKQL